MITQNETDPKHFYAFAISFIIALIAFENDNRFSFYKHKK